MGFLAFTWSESIWPSLPKISESFTNTQFNVLAGRYAPLEAENTTKSISEFLAFRRVPRTRLRSGAVGLLVDPGAHDNLIGEVIARQMCQELSTQLELRALDKPLPVEGVGKSANQSACVRMAVRSA